MNPIAVTVFGRYCHSSWSWSRYKQFLQRFVQDDGSICLGFLGVAVLVLWGEDHIRKRQQQRMSPRSPSPDSTGTNSSNSSGLSSTNTTTSSSGLSSMASENDNTKNHNKGSAPPQPDVPVTVPLSRAILWVLLVCVVGFVWGQQFTLTDTPASSDGIDAAKAAAKAAALLDHYRTEHASKQYALPTFHNNKEWATARRATRRKHFAEFIVHPLLLVSGSEEFPDDASETVAIAVNADVGSIDEATDGIELAQDLIHEILLHKDVEEITVFLVSSTAATHQTGCPPGLEASVEAATAETVKLECLLVDPSWGHEREGHIDDHLMPDEGFDVSIVLSGCHSKSIQERVWEKELYDSTNSMVSTCTGARRPQGRPLTSLGVEEQHLRLDRIEQLLTETKDKTTGQNSYTQIVDYDVQNLNMAVAFHKNMDDGTYKWHLNEANHNLELLWRLETGVRDTALHYFEAPDMTRLQFPSRASADSFCRYLDDYDELVDDDEYYCNYGFDPYVENIPIDKMYVSQSTSGENAGRGVFTSVDLLEVGTMIGMETNVHSVSYPPMSKALVNNVVDMKIYDSYDEKIDDDDEDDDDDDDEDEYIGGDSKLMTTGLHRSPSTYAEAYGFDDEPWGIPQTSVYSNILTFTNHGCNGTANIGHNTPGLNEFTMDTRSPNFTIPDAFKQFSAGEYSPNRDRAYLGSITTSSVAHPPILAGTELFDNYLVFGGDEGFIEQVQELQRDCSGALGTVERHQILLAKRAKPTSSDHKPDPLHKKRRKDMKKEEDDDDDDDEEDDDDDVEISQTDAGGSDEL